MIGKQVRITQKGIGDSVRLWPSSHERKRAPFTAVWEGECTGYSFHTPNAFYIQIAGFGQVDIAEPGITVELVKPWWGYRFAIYMGLAEPPYCF